MSASPSTTACPSPTMQAILDRLAREDRGAPDPTVCPAPVGRRAAADANRRWNRELPPMADVHGLSLAGGSGDAMPARLFVPPDDRGGLVLYLHGGGFAFCGIDTHERAIRTLALETRTAVLGIDYRLAPEHPYPAALGDCLSAVAQLHTLRARFPETRGPFALSGDSAGANLALALMLALRAHHPDAPLPIDHAMLFYGVYGTDFETPSYEEFADGPGLTRAKMQRYLGWYAPPGTPRDDPLLAPLLASDEALRALPPLYLNAARLDPLRSDTERLFDRLLALGRADRLDVVEGVVHGFMQMTIELPPARDAFRRAARDYRRVVGR